MKNQIDLLAKIQAKDLVLDELIRSLEKGPKLIKRREEEIGYLEDELATEKGHLEETRKLQRELEAQVETGIDRIKKSKAKLVNIKSNKEYQALLNEIEKQEQSNAENEDKIIGCMEEMEKIRDLFREKEKKAVKIREEVNREIDAIREDLEKTKAKLEEGQLNRDNLARDIDDKLLHKYEILKGARDGLAVVQVEKATCSGCNMSIPPQMFNELQRMDELMFCPNCERIIFWERPDTGQE